MDPKHESKGLLPDCEPLGDLYLKVSTCYPITYKTYGQYIIINYLLAATILQ